MTECAICGETRANVRECLRGDWQAMRCARCGDYQVSGSATVTLLQMADADRAYLSAWVRQEGLRTAEGPALSTARIEQVLANRRRRSIAEQQDALLLALARQSAQPGAWFPILREQDFVLAWAQTPAEFDFHVETLQERGLIEDDGTLDTAYRLTAAGWDRVSELEAPRGPDGHLVFVAMAFAVELRTAWSDGLRPALETAGYTARRVDSEEHLDKIDDRIMAMIRESRFVVVDVTTQNRGAYFEAGFALGLGRRVIWTVREDDLDKVHFDTRQFNHIVWTDPVDLKEKLATRIVAVFGRGTAGTG